MKPIKVRDEDHKKIMRLRGKMESDMGLPIYLGDALHYILENPQVLVNGLLVKKLEFFWDENPFIRATFLNGDVEDSPVLKTAKVE